MMNYLLKSVQLNDTQRAIIEGSPNVIIKGLAGTGKTMTVVHLAEKLAEHYTVGIVVFTRSLARFLRECIKNENVEIGVLLLKSRHLDYLIVDEVQDFTMSQILHFHRQCNGIYYFGDDNQNLYKWMQKNFATSEKIRLQTSFPIIELTQNFRLPSCIENYSNVLLNSEILNEKDYNSAFSILKWKNSCRNLLPQLLLKEFSGTTAIICNRNEQVRMYKTAFEEYGYDNVGYKTDEELCLNTEDENAVNVLTFHASKGLEFRNVFIIGGRKEREYRYVGYTRASEYVVQFFVDFDGNVGLRTDILGDHSKYLHIKSKFSSLLDE